MPCGCAEKNLFRAYWHNTEATAKAFEGTWFDTGDLGAFDANGFLTLAGRSTDLIITNGYNVYPQVVKHTGERVPGGARIGRVRVARSLFGVKRSRRPWFGPTRRWTKTGCERSSRRGWSITSARGCSCSWTRCRETQWARFRRPNCGPSSVTSSEESYMLDPAGLAIAALVLVVVVSCTTRVNPGLLALVLAWLIGVSPAYLCERPVGLKVVIDGLPMGLFLTLTGVTLLFALVQDNGPLAGVAHRAVLACGGHRALVPVLFFTLQ